MYKKVVLLLAGGTLVGCATSSMDYSPPTPAAVPNTRSVSTDFEKSWDQLVRQLSSDFFVINNIDKSSRLINVSFSTSRPSEYVDCGSTLRKFSNARGEQVYNYVTADSAKFAVTNQNAAFNVSRETKLEGRVNIYVAPGKGGTDISVNTKYVFTVNAKIFGFDGSPVTVNPTTIDFSTKSPYTSPDLTCYARGTLESRILDMVM
ncbi:hypothetical protein [Pseudomonas sp. NBRC 111127]|uniref:hypothetical protein n=1 Tax=Pseudomonas sp. NBRC 111127 TaxID=1661042 RepID=UPI000ACCE559|nr:hypothetical protein [Pseudomonas sp. NBRC 111127]